MGFRPATCHRLTSTWVLDALVRDLDGNVTLYRSPLPSAPTSEQTTLTAQRLPATKGTTLGG